MKIGAKIDILLKEKRFAIIDDFLAGNDKSTIIQALLQYGMSHPQKIVCSVLAKQKQTDKVIAGSFKMTYILSLIRSNTFDVKQFIPIGALSQDCSVKQLIQKASSQLIQKKGNIVYTKPKPREYLKQSKKILVKKTSQKNKNDEKEEPINIKNVKDLKKTKSNNENTKQVQIKTKENLKTTTSTTSKKLLKIQPVNESSQEYFNKQYIIEPQKQPPTKVSSVIQITKQQAKEEQTVKMQEENNIKIQQKAADLDLEDQDQFELIMAKQNKKNQTKPQNKCTNVPEKQEKKTTQKIVTSNAFKHNSASTQQKSTVKTVGQPKLFAFMQKK